MPKKVPLFPRDSATAFTSSIAIVGTDAGLHKDVYVGKRVSPLR